jgi:hypothetical protein
MPHINWHSLPSQLRAHLEDRLRTREISKADLVKLMEWIRSNPAVPEGAWCKDFGTFKLVGHGALPGTLLTKDQPCFGMKI